jgi:hypothetical protein
MTRLALPLTLLVLASACHKDSTEEEANADEYFYQCGDSKRPASLTVFATDEVYREFLDRVAATGFMKSDAQAPQLTTPAPGGTLSIAAPPAFTFTAGMTLRTKDAAPQPGRPPRRSRWAWVKDAFTLERKAWAHCPNVTGTVYLLQLTAEGQKDPAYQALASVVSFTPDATVWKDKMQGLSGKKVTLTLARGVFSMGHLELGPFIPEKDITFTVGP